jgi:hypothetical protein
VCVVRVCVRVCVYGYGYVCVCVYVRVCTTERAAVGRAISAGIRLHRRSHLLVTAYTLRNQRATGESTLR